MKELVSLNKDSLIIVAPIAIVRNRDSEVLVALLDNSSDFFLLKGNEAFVWRLLMGEGQTLSSLFGHLIEKNKMNRDDVSTFLTKFIQQLNILNLINILQ